MKHKPEGTYIEHIAHEDCGSSDGLAVYEREDGSIDGYCWACKKFEPDPYNSVITHTREKVVPIDTSKIESIKELPSPAIDERGLNKETVEYYGVKVAGDKWAFPYYHGKELVAYKVREKADKKFYGYGSLKNVDFFGANKVGSGGRLLIVTEGEFDAMAATQMLRTMGKNYRVVSLPNGANVNAVKQHLEWLEKFESVVLCLDQDEPGQQAAEKICELLSPGKASIMGMSEKDANNMLIAGKAKEFYNNIWQASEYRPDGIVAVSDVLEEALRPVEKGLDWPWPTLTAKTYGRRRKELYGFGAGSGCGKTEGFKEIIQHVIDVDKTPVGLMFLEEQPAMTLKQIAGKIYNKRFHIPDGDWTVEELKEGITALDGLVFLYDHFGQKDWDSIKSKIRYMVVSLGIKDIFLDHLTALVADEPDTNAALGRIMEDMASLTQELDFTLYFISHLSTPSGDPHEEGGRVKASQFRGSRTITFWSHYLFGYERNQQADSEDARNTTTFRVLKDRYTGLATGLTFSLFFDHTTGRMLEQEEQEFNDLGEF